MVTNDLHVAKSNAQFSVVIFYDYLAIFNTSDHSFLETFLLTSITPQSPGLPPSLLFFFIVSFAGSSTPPQLFNVELPRDPFWDLFSTLSIVSALVMLTSPNMQNIIFIYKYHLYNGDPHV